MIDDIPDIPVKDKKKRSLWDRVSVVWLVPLLALIVALSVAWQSYNDRGPVIEIIFDSAAGVAKDETELRFRDVTVGVVEGVRFTEDLDRVIVAVRLDKGVAPYVDEGSEFWIVSPEVTTQGVSGLDTVLSGVYIQGLWDDNVETLTYEFEGLSEAPLLTAGQTGIQLLLRSTDGSLSGNTPILYKGVEVGRIGQAMVSADGFSVEAEAVVYAPYDNLVTRSTRFWDTSGFSLTFGTSGAAVDFESIASLIAGGVTFDTFVSGALLAADGDEFDVFEDDDTARASIFNRVDGVSLDLTATFDGNVAGLVTGAPVEFNGLPIGEVSGLNGVVEDTPSGGTRVRLQTVLSIQPSRLGMEGSQNAEDALQFLADQVEGGLRARLTTGSLLTGGLKVQLLPVTDAQPAFIDFDTVPFPSIPVTESEITDVATTAQGTLDRIDNLRIEELIESATSFLNNASILVGSPETQAVPGDVSALVTDLRAVVGSEDVQALPDQLGALMAELEATVGQVRGILTTLDEAGTVAEVTAAVQSVQTVTASVEASLEGVPALVAEITTLAETANTLELAALVEEAQGLAANARMLLAAEGLQGLPDQVAAAVSEVQNTLQGLNEGDGIARVLAAVDSAGAAAATLETSLEGLPELITQIEAVAANAAGLPLEALVDQITGLSADAQALIGSDAAQALPEQVGALSGELQATLVEINQLVAEMNENDAATRLLAAVDAAAAAAGTVEGSFDGVPDLIARIDGIAMNAEALDLETLVAQVTSMVASAEALVSSPDTQDVPAALSSALSEVSAVLAELRDGGAVENTNAALISARRAADEIAAATAGLPALLSRANALIAQADTTLGGFEDTSPAIRDARDALRQVQEAAQAVQSLARTLERSPLLRR